MSVVEIEKAVAKLPADDVKALAEWITESQGQLWNKQIEAGRIRVL